MRVLYEFRREGKSEALYRCELGVGCKMIAGRHQAAKRPDNSPLWGRPGEGSLIAARAICDDLCGQGSYPEHLPRLLARWWLDDLQGQFPTIEQAELTEWLDDLVVCLPGEDLPDLAVLVLAVEEEAHAVVSGG